MNPKKNRRQGVILNALFLSHRYVGQIVRPGDLVVDATAGNGGDTLFLADLAGETGHVHAFDIQAEALQNTAKRLKEAGLYERCSLHLSSHDRMDEFVPAKVRAVMFNLGYLPGGDHQIGTRPETTLAALEKARRLLLPGGIITIGLYYGGDSGFEERDAVLAAVRDLDVHSFAVQQIEMVNSKSCPPIFICIEKLA